MPTPTTTGIKVPSEQIELRGENWTIRHTPLALRMDGHSWSFLVDPSDRSIIVSTNCTAAQIVARTAEAITCVLTSERTEVA